MSGRWAPQIGDPDLTGWLTVAAYLLCFALAIAVCRHPRRGVARGFWALIAMLMLALAVNKQLDLQSAVTAAGRCLARVQGWYGDRRTVQMAFIVGLVAMALTGLFLGTWALRGKLRWNGLALVGLVILSGFVVIRAVGFHHVDIMLGWQQMGVTGNYILENAGLALIALNALMILCGCPKGNGPSV